MNSTKLVVMRRISLALAGLVAVLGCQASFRASAGGEGQSGSSPAPATSTAPAASTTTPVSSAAPASSTTAAPQQTSRVELRGDVFKMPGNLVFETGSAALTSDPGNAEVLEQFRIYLEENPRVTQVRIEGHTDNQGTAESNLELGGNRALTIKNWLVGKGVAAERLLAVGFGDTKPIADNASEEGRAQNRRTEFRLAGINGKKYLGRDPSAGGKVFGQ